MWLYGSGNFDSTRDLDRLESKKSALYWISEYFRPRLLVVLVSRPPSSQHVTSDGGCDGGTQYQHDLAWDRAPPAASVSEPLVTPDSDLGNTKLLDLIYCNLQVLWDSKLGDISKIWSWLSLRQWLNMD